MVSDCKSLKKRREKREKERKTKGGKGKKGEQGRIHGSISCVRVGRGSIVVGQGQYLKSDL